jgi:hypothetical protein
VTGVVIRCPNCGTTQAALGECDACHESETRYFCPNHSPGRWLDEPACSACGARLGVPPAGETSPTRPGGRASGAGGTRSRSRTPASPRGREATPLPPPPPPVRRRRRPLPPEEPPPTPDDAWSGPVRTPERGEFDVFDVLEDMAARSRTRRPRDEPPPPPLAPRVPLALSTAFGCVRRLVMLVVILAVLAVIATLVFFYMFGVGGPLNRATGVMLAPSPSPPAVTWRPPPSLPGRRC